MQGSEIELQAGGTRFSAYRGRPPGGSGAGVVLLHEGFGLDDCSRELVDRLARAGFIALAPALPRATPTRSPREALLRENALDEEASEARIASAIRALLGDPGCLGPRVGVVALGASAELGLAAGGANPRVGALVDLARLPGDIASVAKDTAPRLLLVLGDEDPACAVDAVAQRVERLAEHGFEVEVRRQPGAGPDFMSEARVDRFDARAAAESWDSAIAFLREAL